MKMVLLDSFRGCLLGSIIVSRIHNGTTTLQDWEIISQKIIIDLIHKENISIKTIQDIGFHDSLANSGELILGTLPLILFFYETEFLLLEQLERIGKNTNIIEENIKQLLLFQEILNLILKREKNLFKNISNLSQSLEKLETFLEHQTLLAELKRQFRQPTVLESHYLLLSLYCFARTPDNFKLSVLQASQFNHPLILGVTAALSGAYNGYSNIPIPWRLIMSSDDEHRLKDQQIPQLWAKWTGVDDPLKTRKPLNLQIIHPVKVNKG